VRLVSGGCGWEPASFGAVHDLLTNPAYASAYASFYQPRHRTAVVDLRTGRVLRELPTAQPPRLVVAPTETVSSG
jgi:hypothetical protein